VQEIETTQDRDAMMSAMNKASESLRPSAGGGIRGGVASEIQAMTLPEVDAFRRAHYTAANARLVIAGRFDVAETAKRIRTAFANVPGGKPPTARAAAGSRVTGTLVMGDVPKAVALAVAVPDPKDPIYPAFVVLATRLAIEGVKHPWKANFAPLARPDVLLVTSHIPSNQPAEAFAEQMRTEVSSVVKAPLGPDEAAGALTKYGGVLGLRTAAMPLETAFALGRRSQLGFDAKALEQAIQTVTPQQITAAAQLFDPKSSAAVIAGGKT
jgi:predicted Zn-dependent peptidase